MTETLNRLNLAAEERANAVTHGIGAVLSLVGLIVLLLIAGENGEPVRVVAAGVFGVSLLALYAASTCYHAAKMAPRKRLFRMFDHAAIYGLIAGTYTPVTLITLRSHQGWLWFGIVWGLALLGIVATVRFPGRFKPLRVGLYLAMGWMAVFIGEPLLALMPEDGVIWLGAGGVAYTVGTVVYLWRGLPYGHAIWHVFVMGGSACHFVCVAGYVLPVQS